jgi:DNA-binding transcriptional LysR family regulator
MDRFREMEAFVAVADANGFAKGARRLNASAPAITRLVSALEDRLGVRLFNRTTRSLSLTEPGSHFLEAARSVLSEIDAAEKETIGETSAPMGHLIITGSVTFGRSVLTPIVTSFLQNHPRVTACVRLFDRVVNLVEEGIDVGVRIAELPDSTLVARRIGTVQRMFVTSPAYLDRHGVPQNPADLQTHQLISFAGLTPTSEWSLFENGKAKHIAIAPRMEINDAAAAINTAEAGEGITTALSYMVADKIRGGSLVPVLSNYCPPPTPVHLVYPQNRLVAPKVRAFMDFAAPLLQKRLAELEIQ